MTYLRKTKNASLLGRLLLACLPLFPATAYAGGKMAVSVKTAPSAATHEIAFWKSINKSNSKQLHAYLSAYPDGAFAKLAHIRMKKIKILKEIQRELDALIVSYTGNHLLTQPSDAQIQSRSDDIE